ncbi:TPMT family class I SAM-dependent methyltransferase [Winogradskyella immobilis]|uniref:SAM-dependent methyltransferase n=1 Tax=Winogradskyella immobilis TaxID=2816852 RepID=A0ABS8ENM0_9FLAO|nr:TPMT family class I SAM-dependent methyltransferase [Winogradskyella immobilis]MCC1484160.1 SAM-dependent methyltransferase [Winogradskyella immobilis]MCG0016252.1 SAM-dependent methyltransferase [Winogradskyella immobilis]
MARLSISEREKQYWSQRYIENRTCWDLGESSRPLVDYIDQLEDKSIKILIPGAGNAFEAEYLFNNGFKNVFVLDIAPEPLILFSQRNPNFPKTQLIEGDFFEHVNLYDLIIEQTFFCSFPPKIETRKRYAKKMNTLLQSNGKLVGLWFNIPLKGDLEKRPFGGDKKEYLSYLSPWFNVKTFENAYNSVESRLGKELFGVFEKKHR